MKPLYFCHTKVFLKLLYGKNKDGWDSKVVHKNPHDLVGKKARGLFSNHQKARTDAPLLQYESTAAPYYFKQYIRVQYCTTVLYSTVLYHAILYSRFLLATVLLAMYHASMNHSLFSKKATNKQKANSDELCFVCSFFVFLFVFVFVYVVALLTYILFFCVVALLLLQVLYQ